MKMRYYVIVCMKRTDKKRKVYWRSNRAGYTDNLNEAGYYTANELDQCAGSNGDWIVEPIWR